MFISTTVNIKLDGLEKFKQVILSGDARPIQVALKRWAVRYRSYAQLRFDTFSKSGGDWQKLAASTLKGRRKSSAGIQLKAAMGVKPKPTSGFTAQVAILRDTGTLFAALSPVFVGSPGAIEESIPNGVRVGYGGPQRHIGGNGKKSSATIADIASFHQNGVEPRLPRREIIVEPSQELLQTMADDMTKAMEQVSSGSGT